MKNINCYIHIPFCNKKCKYCRFASFSWLNQLAINNYVNFLCKEIISTNWKYCLDTIYFWWWTPTTLSLSQFEKIFLSLREKFTFSENIEISIESTPEMVTIQSLEWWEKLWVNRLSVWIQSLNPKTLKEIQRSEKWDILQCFETLEKYFQESKKISFSLDFIIGLPFMKKWELLENIKFLLENYSFVKHISVYMLEEYYEVPEEIDSKFENIIYPNSWKANSISEEDYLEEYISIKAYLKEKWFSQYEISNFAKPGFECKHNCWYWSHKENLAFGLWAHGFVENTRFSNSEDFIDYYAKRNIFKENLSEENIFFEKVMFSIRTKWISKCDLKQLNQEKVNYFLKIWYLEEKWEKIILAEKAVLLLDYILSEIL